MNTYVLPYRWNSRSAKAICRGLEARRIKTRNSNYRPRLDDLVINWGNTEPNVVLPPNTLNHPDHVREVSNKLRFFANMLHKVRIPEVTECPYMVSYWLREGFSAVQRNSVAGNSGEGIVILKPEEDVGPKPGGIFYTKFIPKDVEYRVHFFNGKIIDVQKKSHRNGERDLVDPYVRNHKGGWIFTRGNIGDLPEDVTRQTELLLENVKVDFGAADIIYSNEEEKAYVLEVNSAPGLTGTTLKNYIEAFKDYKEELKNSG